MTEIIPDQTAKADKGKSRLSLAPDVFSQDWWCRWASKTNEIGSRYPGQLTVDLICALTAEMERINHDRN